MPLFAILAKAHDRMPVQYSLLIIVALLVGAFVLGGWMSRRFRMPDYGWKIGVCLAFLFVSSFVTWVGWPPKFGIDLSGGAILVYQVEKGDRPNVDMTDLCQKISMRVNPGGMSERVVRTFGPDQVEIIIPNVDEEEARRVEKRISTIGSLEFRILANTRDHRDIIERAKKEDTKKIKDTKGDVLAWWVPVNAKEEAGFRSYPEIATREREINKKKVLEILVVKDPYDVTGKYLLQSSRGVDEKGNPCVEFSFTSDGADLFGQLTGDNMPDAAQGFTRKLGIILDEYLFSAPSIQSRITNRGQITGRFTNQEVLDLVSVLNAGSLPATLSPEPLSRLMIGPTLGQDTIDRSKFSMILASALVVLFMFWYYRFAGLVANIALTLNLLVLLAVMISVKAAFTLSGLAGLALTVGMAVDNNVLVYERLREELAAGATLRMAIRNAFHRAATVIIDANLTHLIAATVLYVIGSDQVKGFAITLGLGSTISMFTSVFVARVIFDISERQGWIKDVKMLHVIGHTNIDFMRLFPYCGTFSLIITVLGLIVTGMRGQALLDIDFTGGVSVQTIFAEPAESTGWVRKKVEDAKADEATRLDDVVVTDVKSEDKPLTQFVINTSEQDMGSVQKKIQTIFSGMLATNSVEIDNVKPIAASEAKAEDDKKTDGADAFAGGTQAQFKFAHNLDHDSVVEFLAKAAEPFAVGTKTVAIEVTNPDYSENNRRAYPQWTVRLQIPVADAEKVFETVKKEVSSEPRFPASNKIGSAVAEKTQLQAIYALLVSWGCIMLYLWLRFQGVAFGLAAVIGLVHDVLVMLAAIALSYWLATPFGFLGIEPFKVNLPIIAAFLTIVGYSVNDTIIIFDRIREVRGKSPFITRDIVNKSTNQTLGRTLITSFTVFLVVLVLYIAGGSPIHGFAFALLVGVITGTYSSIYVSAPILLWLVKPRGVKKAR